MQSEDVFSIEPGCDVRWRGVGRSYESDFAGEGEMGLELAEELLGTGVAAASPEGFALLGPSPPAWDLFSEPPSDLLSDLPSAPLAGAGFFPDLA